MAGKGDKFRPVNKEVYDKNFEMVFGKKKLNNSEDNKKNFWTGPGYRGEYNCPHNVGHGNHIHGCCHERCCTRDDFPLRSKNG